MSNKPDKPESGEKRSQKYDLAREIFNAPSPESFTRSLPAQSLYVTCLRRGLSSSLEILEMASREQFQLLLDFDLWKRDRLNEDQFWNWLELPDESNDLTILQKILQSIDLKILCLIFSRYVDVISNEEPTEEAPDIHFSTPDKGHTWIRSQTQDEHKDFLLKRLLALIFETDSDLFYQLLSVPTVSTPSMLEEESYIERAKRVEAEGIPSVETSIELHTGISLESTIKKLASDNYRIIESFDIRAVRPLVYDSRLPSPLKDLAAQIQSPEKFETEITLLLNSGCIYWAIDLSDKERIEMLAGFIRGCINLALEALLESTDRSLQEIYSAIGLIEIYRTGLSQVLSLKELALDISRTEIGTDTDELLLHSLKLSPPLVPDYIQSKGGVNEDEMKNDLSLEERLLSATYNPIEHQSLIHWLRDYLKKATRPNIAR